MEILIIDNDSKHIPKIKKNVESNGFSCQIVNYLNCKDVKLENIKGIILSGSTHNPFRLLPYLEPLVRQAVQKNIPLLGICAGHEVLGIIYGVEPGKYANKLKKNSRINLLKQNLLFKNLPKAPEFFESHIRYIPLPENFELLANSSTAENEAMKLNGKQVYSTQFHPELSGKNGEIIFKNFLELC